MKIKFIVIILSILISCKKEVKLKNTEKVQTQIKTQKTQNIFCFAKEDILKLDIYFNSIKKDINTNDEKQFKFSKQEDYIYLKRLIKKKGFVKASFKENKTSCDSIATYMTFFLDEFDDGDEIHYSESSIWVVLKRKNQDIEIIDVGGAG